MARAGYVPCPADGGCCPGRAWASNARWLDADTLLAEYPATDCGHCGPSVFVLTLDAATLDAADERDRALYGAGDAP